MKLRKRLAISRIVSIQTLLIIGVTLNVNVRFLIPPKVIYSLTAFIELYYLSKLDLKGPEQSSCLCFLMFFPFGLPNNFRIFLNKTYFLKFVFFQTLLSISQKFFEIRWREENNERNTFDPLNVPFLLYYFCRPNR